MFTYSIIYFSRVIANYLSKENDNLQLEQSKIEKTSPTMKHKELTTKKDETSTDDGYRRSFSLDQTTSQPSSPKLGKAKKVLETDEMIVPNLTQAGKCFKSAYTIVNFSVSNSFMVIREISNEAKC